MVLKSLLLLLVLQLLVWCKSQDQPLLSALFAEDFDEVRNILATGSDPNEVDAEFGWTPLQVATYQGNIEFVRLFVDAGARVNDGCKDGWTPLIIACREGHLDISKYLISKGADLFKVSKNMLSSYVAARLSGNAELKEYIMNEVSNSHRVSLYTTNKGRISLLLAASHYSDGGTAVQAILENGADPNLRSETENITPLMFAASVGASESIAALLRAGADPNMKDDGGWTALMYAVQYRCEECAELLLEASASAHLTNNEGLTASHMALQRGDNTLATGIYDVAMCNSIIKEDIESIVALVGVGGDPNLQCDNDRNYTPLVTATKVGSLSALNILLEYGALPNIPESDLWTPLMFAAAGEDIDILQRLLDAGADISAVNNRGQTALDLAELLGGGDTVHILEKAASRPATTERAVVDTEKGLFSGYNPVFALYRSFTATGHHTDGHLVGGAVSKTYHLRASSRGGSKPSQIPAPHLASASATSNAPAGFRKHYDDLHYSSSDRARQIGQDEEGVSWNDKESNGKHLDDEQQDTSLLNRFLQVLRW